MCDSNRIQPGHLHEIALFGLQGYAVSSLAVALFGAGTTNGWMWLFGIVVAATCWQAYLAVKHRLSAWRQQVASCLAFAAAVAQLAYYLHGGGSEVVVAFTALLPLAGAVAAALVLAGKTAWADPSESPGPEPRDRSVWAAVSLVLAGLTVLLVIIAAFLRGTGSAWWHVPSLTVMWCSLVHAGLVERKPIRVGAAAICGTLLAPAVTAWFYPVGAGLQSPWPLGVLGIGFYTALVIACACLASGPPPRPPRQGPSSPRGHNPPPPRPVLPSTETAANRWDVTP